MGFGVRRVVVMRGIALMTMRVVAVLVVAVFVVVMFIMAVFGMRGLGRLVRRTGGVNFRRKHPGRHRRVRLMGVVIMFVMIVFVMLMVTLVRVLVMVMMLVMRAVMVVVGMVMFGIGVRAGVTAFGVGAVMALGRMVVERVTVFFSAFLTMVLIGFLIVLLAVDRLRGMGRIGLGMSDDLALDAFAAAAAARTAVTLPPPAGAVLALLFGLAMGAFVGFDQRLTVGDRDLVIVGVNFAEGEEAVAIAAIFDEGRLE
jgi:hypothetical protein